MVPLAGRNAVAQKVQVILVDDLDGGEATETVSFSLDGISYEIDLSEENALSLREALAPYVGNARRVGGRGGGRTRRSGGREPAAAAAPAERGGRRSDATAIREWAREHGYEVSDRGRISAEIREAYENAQG